ncbi:MAG: M23 family metallopeptidase [Candidatus Nanoarchaeia archaeon]
MSLTKNVYVLPVKKKDLTLIVSDPRAHSGYIKEALDFIVPEGSLILASRSGKVIDVKMDSKVGGLDPKYADKANYITLEHENDECSQYVHLKHKGALVKVGDIVKRGQPIGLSGNTGFTSIPHLHFMVFEWDNSQVGWHSVKIRFKEKISVVRSSKVDLKVLIEELKKR